MKNVGLHQRRFKQNPKEEKIAKLWEENNERSNILGYLLAKNINDPVDGEVSKRDRQVAATVIQWLGSTVGEAFLRKAYYDL